MLPLRGTRTCKIQGLPGRSPWRKISSRALGHRLCIDELNGLHLFVHIWAAIVRLTPQSLSESIVLVSCPVQSHALQVATLLYGLDLLGLGGEVQTTK